MNCGANKEQIKKAQKGFGVTSRPVENRSWISHSYTPNEMGWWQMSYCTRCNWRLLWCFHHACCREGCCVCALCSRLEKSMGVYRERWEIHRGGVTQQILLFHVFSSRQPVLAETNHHVSFSIPDLCAVPVSLQRSSSLDQNFCFSFFR